MSPAVGVLRGNVEGLRGHQPSKPAKIGQGASFSVASLFVACKKVGVPFKVWALDSIVRMNPRSPDGS